jgi:hypothetical protein
MMTKDMKDLLSIFNARGVEYLVIGGYAFGVHLEPRTTKDLDVFIRSNDENAKAVFEALIEFGAPLAAMSPADFQDGTIFQLGIEPERVDIVQKIDGVTFDEAWANRIQGKVDGEVPAAVISREDLIRNKLASGRDQDLLDVKKLRAMRERS